jgi:hypothetical protein
MYLKNQKIHTQNEKRPKIDLENMVSEFPKFYIRKVAAAIDVSPTLVYHIIHDDLHLIPYKFHLWHKLEEPDYQKRIDFAQWFLKLGPETKKYMIMSDEVYFYLALPVNIQNNRCWCKSQPIVSVEKPLQDKKILVYFAISANRVFGTYFFEESINQLNYLFMLKYFYWPWIEMNPELKKHYFQQDGASPHIATSVQTWLKDNFDRKFIDKNSWPHAPPI